MSSDELQENIQTENNEASDSILRIKKVFGTYAKILGLADGDLILGIDGNPFNGTLEDFKGHFEIDEEDEEAENLELVLTIKRGDTFFNVICCNKLICKFETAKNSNPEPTEDLLKMLESAKNIDLNEYLIYHDNKKNAELLLRSKSLLAMVVPPFWFLNQRVPEAALASILALVASLSVHWILGVIYYGILCMYVGREQVNLAMSFMSYKRRIYMQVIAATSDIEAQTIAISLDKDLYFEKPAEGLIQNKRSRRKKNTSSQAQPVT